MASKQRVPLLNNPKASIPVEADATKGSTLGVNTYDTDGSVISWATILARVSAIIPATAQLLWNNIIGIPANIKAIAAITTTGFYVRTGAGTAATRAITVVPGELTESNGDGVAANPQLGLANVAAVAGGTLQAFTSDGKGRITHLRNASQADIDTALGYEAVQSIVPGDASVIIDDTDPRNPIIYVDVAGADISVDDAGWVWLVGDDVQEVFDWIDDLFGDVDAALAAKQPLDTTLTNLAAANWAANAIPIGSGVDTVAQVSFAANTFPARGSTGNLVAKAITDDALLLLADADVPRLSTVNTWDLAQTFTAAPIFSDAAGTRSALGLVIGTNVQAFDAGLQSIAGLTTAADRSIYTTALDTYAVYTLTAGGRALAGVAGTANTFPYFSALNTVTLGSITTAGRALLDDANADAQLTTLGATTVGASFFKLANPGAIRFPRIDAANTVTARSASDFLTDIGALPSASYTAADVLAKLLTVDGAGSGLDADLLDGQSGAYYQNAGNLNAGTLLDARVAASNVTQHQAALTINYSQLTGTPPPLLVTEVFTVASQAAQLALTAEEGDIAIRTDLNKSYAHNGGTSGTMADWSELLTPTDTVLSFNGRIGAIVPQVGDYSAFYDSLGSAAAAAAASLPLTGGVMTGDILFNDNPFAIRASTADGSDTQALALISGGSANIGRGGFIILYGNEHATNPGEIVLYSGDAVGAKIHINSLANFAVAPTFTDASTTRTNLGLAIGTNVQAYSARLAAFAGSAIATDTIFIGTGVDAGAQVAIRPTSLTSTQADRITDLDAEIGRVPAFISAASTATGLPIAAGMCGVHMPFSSVSGAQLLVRATSADSARQLFFRSYSGSVLTSWAELWSTANMTVTADALLLLADADVPRLGTPNAWSGTNTFSSAHYDTGVESPASWAANVDNLAIAATTRVLRVQGTAARDLTGIVPGSAGRRVLLCNIGTFNITLKHNLTSTAANRFFCPGSVDFVLGTNESVELWYDTTSSRWRVVAF